MSAPLDPAALRALLEGAAVLAVDTNVVQGRALMDLANQVQAVNHRRPKERALGIVVPALVHAERVFQLRRQLQFDPARLERAWEQLGSKGVRVEPYTEADAEGHGAALAPHYPTDDGWGAAKQAQGGSRPATVDWFIAAQAASRGWLWVSDDRGAEHRWLERRADAATLTQVLKKLGGG